MRNRARTRRTRILAAVATTIAVVASLPGIAAAASGFGDVETDEFYSEAVGWMVAEEITTGVEPGCFGPHDAVTRGQIATFLFRLEKARGNTPATAPHPFTDVTAEYQDGPVGWLFSTGVTTGTSPRSFSPASAITRGDFAVMLWRHANTPRAATPHSFVDVHKTYQERAISWMDGTGITTGTSPTTFDPDGLVTRAQAATFLHRYEGAPEATAAPAAVDCARDMRLALIAGGLTGAEAACAAPYLTDWSIDYLLDVVADRVDAAQDWDLLATVSLVAQRCLTEPRIAELTRLFL